MSDTNRLQRFLERIQEDERLRGDLMGDAATALVQWASEQVQQVAGDPARPDAEVEAAVKTIRMVAAQAARNGDSTPEQVVAEASALLAAQVSPPTAPASVTDDTTPTARLAAQVSPPPADAQSETANLLHVRTTAPFRRARRCHFWKKPARKGR